MPHSHPLRSALLAVAILIPAAIQAQTYTLHTTNGTDPLGHFGSALTLTGDVDGEGIADCVAATSNASPRTRFEVRSSATGAAVLGWVARTGPDPDTAVLGGLVHGDPFAFGSTPMFQVVLGSAVGAVEVTKVAPPQILEGTSGL